jgi:uncharacterized protein YndB with AHSA1/START domain
MAVTDVRRDAESLTLTIVADYAHPPARVWQLWADPRQLERWWGPPTHPATVVEHDLAPGGSVSYYMTGPDGTRYGGFWRIVASEPPRSLEFQDGFADASGAPADGMPMTRALVTLEPDGRGGTRMVIESRFASNEDMERLVEMGMVEGMQQALGQTDAILAEAV